jgi:cbb3-type cytochrome oxidase maturation protein
MDSLYVSIPIALMLLGLAVTVFLWAVKSGQYEDLDREGRRILFEDEDRAKASSLAPDTRPEDGEERHG